MSHSIFCGDLTLQSPRGRGPCCFCQQLNLRGLGLDTSVLHLRSVSFDTNPDANVHYVAPLSKLRPVGGANSTRSVTPPFYCTSVRHASVRRLAVPAREVPSMVPSRGQQGWGGCRGGECLQRRPRPYFFQEGTRSHTVFKKISFTHISGIIDIK